MNCHKIEIMYCIDYKSQQSQGCQLEYYKKHLKFNKICRFTGFLAFYPAVAAKTIFCCVL